MLFKLLTDAYLGLARMQGAISETIIKGMILDVMSDTNPNYTKKKVFLQRH